MLSLYGEKLFANRQTPQQEDHPLSVVRDFIQNIHGYPSLPSGRLSHLQPEGTLRSKRLAYDTINFLNTSN